MKIAQLIAVAVLGLAGTNSAEAQKFGDLRVGVHLGSGGIQVGISTERGDHRHNRQVAPQPDWIPGHWEWCEERVQEPGHYQQVWIEPVYQWHVDACGRRTQVCVRPGYYQSVWCEGEWVTRRVKRWVPGCWSEPQPVCPPPVCPPPVCPPPYRRR